MVNKFGKKFCGSSPTLERIMAADDNDDNSGRLESRSAAKENRRIPDAAQAHSSSTWTVKLLLVTTSLVFLGVLLEIALRVTAAAEARRAPANSSEFWAVHDPDLGYRGNPRNADMNSHGLRSPEVEPKSDKIRLLLLGDSLLFYGNTMEDTVAGHMREAFARDRGARPIEIINAGIKGYTNYQELVYLKKYGLGFDPDMIGLEFCLNDLHEVLHNFYVKDGEIVPGIYQFSTNALRPSEDWAARLAGQTYLLPWLNSKLHVAGNLIRWKIMGGFSFEYKVDVGTAWQQKPWRDVERQLREMQEIAVRRGTPLFIAVFPLGWQYDAGHLRQDRQRVLFPQRQLQEICERLQIPFYDLYADLDASMFDEDSIHLTQTGRTRAGNLLKTFMEDSGVLQKAIRAKSAK
jgi:hypothetical protein